AVARRVDDERLAARHSRDRSAVTGVLLGGEEVGGVEAEAAGPVDVESDPLYWCNPPGRALGVAPTTATGNGQIDAFLWVKR
ncbi:hypothetical protein C6A85_12490, partial [Mycobacterium sp. ITM-2017-0098]